MPADELRGFLARLLGWAKDRAVDDALRSPAVEPLADHVDALVHELTELLGDPALPPAPVPSARPAFDQSVDEDGPTQVHEHSARWNNVPTKRIEVPSPIAPPHTPRTTRHKIAIDRALLETLLAHAMSAARLVGTVDDGVGGALPEGLLADDIDAIAHELSEMLGKPHLRVMLVPSACSMFALAVVPRDDVVTQGDWTELEGVAP